MTYPNNTILRCGGIIFNKEMDSVLVVMNKFSYLKGENKWGFPKGHRKPAEKIYHCAKREIEEETGLVLPSYMFKKRINIFNTIYYIIFLKQDYDSFHIHDTKEIVKVEWRKLQDLKINNFNRDIRKFLQKNKNPNNFDLCEKQKSKYGLNKDKNSTCGYEMKHIMINNEIISY